MSSIKQHAATKVARAVRAQDPVQIAEARQELAAATVEAAIQDAIATTPLAPTDVERLSGLLRTGVQR